nr:CAP domain-containing protein [Paracoccus marcusii]
MGSATCTTTTSTQQDVGVRVTNTARARAGLDPVSGNDILARAAAQHACDMAERGRMTHAGSRTTGPSQRLKAMGYAPSVTAENIAAGPYDLSQVLAQWNASPSHASMSYSPKIGQ